MSLAEILQASLEEIRNGHDVVTLSHNETIAQALVTLADKRLLSAPIVVEPDIEDGGGMDVDGAPTLIGWLDIRDIVTALLSFVESKNAEHRLPTMMLSLMSDLEKLGGEFATMRLVSVPCIEDRKLVHVDDAPSTSLLTVIRQCFVEPGACHRIALYDRYGAIVDVVSQLDVLAFIDDRLAGKTSGNNSLDHSLEELGFLQTRRPVVSVGAHESMLHALSKMKKEGVSSAPVIAGDSDAMIANLSLSDLAGRALRPEHFGVLALPVAEFLALVHGTAYIGYSRSSFDANHPYFASQGVSTHPKPPNTTEIHVYAVKRSTSLRQAIGAICRHRLHHLYVCEDSMRVEAVISITDILQFIAGVL